MFWSVLLLVERRSKSYIILQQKIGVLLQRYAIVAIGVLAVLVASAGVYGVSNMNNLIQAKPGQTLPDYSAKLDSIKSQIVSMNSQIDSMNAKLAALDTLKSDVTDIEGKLTDIQNKTIQISQAPTTVPLALLVDKSAYNPGDTIKITAIGINPLKTVQVQLLDNSGFIIIHKDIWSDSSGKLSYDLQLSSSLVPGNYKVQLVSDQQTQSQPITIVSSSSSQTTTGSGIFTAQTDKSVYQTGNMIQVSGTGQAGTTVTGIMTSPSAKTYSASVTIQPDGNYVMFFATQQPYETGQWNISITNLGQSKTLSIYIGTSSSTNTFTAQTYTTVYQRGESVQVTGTGTTGSAVSGTMTGPTGKTYGSSATIRADGTFSMSFSTISSDATGQWSITVTNLGQNKVLSIYLQ